LHLPLIGRRPVTHVPTESHVPKDVDGVGLLTGRDVLLQLIRAREGLALAGLGEVAGGQSLCELSRGGTPLPGAKYHEGAAAALAEARRALCSVAERPGTADADRSVLQSIQAHWRAQSSSPGRAGPHWESYLAGGLDALDQLVGTDRERRATWR